MMVSHDFHGFKSLRVSVSLLYIGGAFPQNVDGSVVFEELAFEAGRHQRVSASCHMRA